MRLLDRNKRTIKYALCQSGDSVMLKDDNGDYTGERGLAYATPVEIRCRVSSASGSSLIDQFGVNVDYDRTIQIEGTGLGITETAVLWIDETDIEKPHDYIITRVAESLNHTTLAVKKVR